jgi:hypothetical protein
MAEVEHHDAQQAVTMLDALCLVYADAYGVEPGTKTSGFRARAEKAATMSGYDLVTATAGGALHGRKAPVYGDGLQTGTGCTSSTTARRCTPCCTPTSGRYPPPP